MSGVLHQHSPVIAGHCVDGVLSADNHPPKGQDLTKLALSSCSLGLYKHVLALIACGVV